MGGDRRQAALSDSGGPPPRLFNINQAIAILCLVVAFAMGTSLSEILLVLAGYYLGRTDDLEAPSGPE